jgi:hypothetical protein
LGNILGNAMVRYFGKTCIKHPELKGERRNCPACERERKRDPEYRKKHRALKKPEVHRKAVRKWRAANREIYLSGALARNAVRRARAKAATGDSRWIRSEYAVLWREARERRLTIDHIVPLAGCRVCGAKAIMHLGIGNC